MWTTYFFFQCKLFPYIIGYSSGVGNNSNWTVYSLSLIRLHRNGTWDEHFYQSILWTHDFANASQHKATLQKANTIGLKAAELRKNSRLHLFRGLGENSSLGCSFKQSKCCFAYGTVFKLIYCWIMHTKRWRNLTPLLLII